MIVILGILATVTVFAVRGITGRGEEVSCAEDRRILQTATESYFAQTETTAIPISDPAVDGVTGTTPEGTLVEFGLLVSVSELHDVDAAGVVTAAAGTSC